MKKKSPISVRKAVEMAFHGSYDTFNGIDLCNKVRAYTGRPALMDGTIMRRLREARLHSQEYIYTCIDTENSTYRKGL
jgi:hypothetical protein